MIRIMNMLNYLKTRTVPVFIKGVPILILLAGVVGAEPKKDLQEASDSKRKQAVLKLRDTKDKTAVSDLVTALGKEKKKAVKLEMIETLAVFPATSTVSALKTTLNESDPEVQEASALALAQLGQADGLSIISGIVLDTGTIVSERQYGLRCLAGVKTTESVNILKEALQDSDKLVRLPAVVSLGKIGTAEAVETLGGALQDKEVQIRLTAVDALRIVGSDRAYVLIGTMTGDSNNQVSAMAKDILKRAGK